MKRNPVAVALAALLAAALLPPAVHAEERADVPEQLKWNTADLYPSEGAWYQAKDDIAARIPKLAEFSGRLGESADVFYQALSSLMSVDQDFTRLYVYASMRLDEDTRLGKPREMTQIAQQLAVQYYSTVSYLRPEILALGAEKVNGYLAAEPRLAPYRMFLDDILRYAPHTLSAPEEKVASQAAIMSDIAGGAYRTFKDADLPYPDITLSTGEKVRLDAQAYTKYRASTVRADRDLVFQSFFGAFKGFERTFGTTLDGNVKTHMFDKDVHKFGSCLEDALFASNVPTAVYTQLIADVHANLPTLHRYLRLRQRMMGVDTLRYEDLYAPIVQQVDLRFTQQQAQDLVLKALAPLGPDYVATLQRGFESRWVDWVPTTGKRSGAYSTGAYGVHPYQLQNFTGLYEEVSTLAHESGHSMHSWLSDRTQPYVTREYKTFVAEVASTLNENLLLHYMLARTQDRDTRLFLLGSRLDDMRQTLFRQVLFAEFELRINEMAEKGEPITGEKLNTLYLSMVREYYGHDRGVCRVDDLYGVEWAYIQHFYLNFYMYQYATSILGSTSIAAQMRTEAALRKPVTKERDAYLAMLSAGSSKDPITLLQDAGVDMTTSAPFAAAMKEMNAIMDEMEKLLAEKPRR
jgi:oligoendopeptidase F